MHESDGASLFGRYSVAYAVFLVVVFSVGIAFAAANFGRIFDRLYAVRKEIALTAVALLIAAGLVEIGIRLVDPYGISFYDGSRKYHLDKLPDDDLVFKHRPNLRKKYSGVWISTNEIGVRDDPIAEKPPSELRIVALGDSVTLGTGVPVEEAYPALLESELQQQASFPVRVINTGVGGYNTEQELRFFERHAETLDADIVTLLYVGNDIEINRGPFDPWSELEWWKQDPVVGIQILFWKSWTYRLVAHFLRYSSYDQLVSTSTQDSPGRRHSMAALEQLADMTERDGVPFIVFMFRMQKDPLTDDLSREIEELSRSRGFLFTDTVDWFRDVDILDVTNSRIDSHPNTAGNQILASGMAAALRQHGLIEPPVRDTVRD